MTERSSAHTESALRIAIVAPYDLSVPGGVSAHIRAQAHALRRFGHTVHVFGPASHQARLSDGETAIGGAIALNVQGTVSGLGLNPLVARRVHSLLLNRRFDIVHIHEPLTPVLPWLFLISGSQAMVGTFHVHRESGHRLYAAFAWFLQPLVRRLDARIAVSPAARETVARYFPGRYEIIPNGIDVRRFRQPAAPPDGWPVADRAILFLGRIEGRKGLPTLIKAMPEVQRHVPGARLVVVGDGPDRASSEHLARSLGCNALFLGRIPDRQVPAYLQTADVFCSPARSGESFGVVLLEAMAAGTPVVASAIDGYSQLLRAGQAGLLTPPDDAHKLAVSLTRALEDETLRRSLIRRGRDTADEYDWSRVALRLESLYRRVLAERLDRLSRV